DSGDPDQFKVAEEFADLPVEYLGGEPYPKTALPKKVAAALAVIPNSKRLYILRGQQIVGSENDPLDWEGWNYICMATWAATSGSKEGFAAFLPWSRKWPKYIAGTEAERARFDRNTVNKWNALFTSPPKDLGAGTIFFLADKAAPGWREEYETEAEDQQEDTQPEKDLPKLIINNSDPTATAKDLAALIATRDDFLFNGNAAVRIAVEAGYPPRALEVVTDAVRVLAHKICTPVIPKGKRYNKVPLSKDIAQLYLHGLEGSWGLRPFNGITTAPILSHDGSIRTASGYDACTGLWCYNIPDITVPTRPTKNDAPQPLNDFRRFFRTFPFADAERGFDK